MRIVLSALVALAACSSKDATTDRGEQSAMTDADAITDADDALPGVFIPPFVDCRDPLPGEPDGTSDDGQVCTNVAISGSTEEGRYFPDYASCDVVLTQRPFWPAPAAGESDPNDLRLQDDDFLTDLAWAKEQIASSGCVCCHDSRQNGGQVGQWDIDHEPIWLDTLSDNGLALFAGLADSSVLGAYPPEENHGFDRTVTGIPTTDTERMQAFLVAELTRRGITEDEARAVPPFGGPIYANQIATPQACGAGVGIDPDGVVHWTGGKARYLYVLEARSKNPGVPPNLDLPEGTLFRLDVLASAQPIESGVAYGATPEGSFQHVPASGDAPELDEGARYHLTVLLDVGVPIANCIFTFGDRVEEPGTPMSDASVEMDAGDADACSGANADQQGFGAACTTDAECGCAADYCALMPGQTAGYCTFTGCVEDPSVCPTESTCFDVSTFQAGAPAICLQP